MKQSIVLAGLAAGLAAANAHHHQHQHKHAARGDDGLYTAWDTTTSWSTVTVTVAPGQEASHAPAGGQQGPPAGGNGQGQGDVSVQAYNPGATGAPKAGPPAGGASSFNPQAYQSSMIAMQSSLNAAQESKNSAQMSINNQPPGTQAPAPSVTYPASQPAVQPSQTQVPVQSQPLPQTSSSAAAQPSSGGGGGQGGEHQAIGTYYGAQGGYGSCGTQLTDDGHTVAVAPSVIGANKENCGKTININANGQSYTAKIMDTCPGCADSPYGHIDIVQGWAHQIDPNIDVAGHVSLTWSFA